jgi:Holliday junction resolvasome RuvABC endonuclease subunit
MSKSKTPIGFPESFCAVDASTNNLAFAFFRGNELKKYGKIRFFGDDIYEKLGDTAHKTMAFFDLVKTKNMVIEKTIFANSPQVAANLALSQGALIGGAKLGGVDNVFGVAPMSWQSYVGTRLLTVQEKKEIRDHTPNRSASWYKAQEREQRKQKTISTVNKRFNISLDDNDIADACGIGMFALDNWTKVVK